MGHEVENPLDGIQVRPASGSIVQKGLVFVDVLFRDLLGLFNKSVGHLVCVVSDVVVILILIATYQG